MPLFHQHNINTTTKLAVWKIEESEPFFHLDVPLPKTISHPHKRLQHLAGRFLLPFLFNDFPNHEIEIADTRKPFLPAEQYHFSISHCSDYAAAMVSSKHRVGIDVELLTPRLHSIKHKFLSNDELQFVHSHPQAMQLQLLSILWSAKEAMYKWYGNGEVDFDKMLLTKPFTMHTNGEIDALFAKNNWQQELKLRYHLFDNLTMVWVMSSEE